MRAQTEVGKKNGEKLVIIPVSLILDKRAKMPGKSSSCNFISFHCFSSLDTASTRVSESSVIVVGFKVSVSLITDFSDKDGRTGETDLTSWITVFFLIKCCPSEKGGVVDSGFSFARWWSALLCCAPYHTKKEKKKILVKKKNFLKRLYKQNN